MRFESACETYKAVTPSAAAGSSESMVQSITSPAALMGAAAIGPTTGTTSRTSPVTRNGSATTAQPESNVSRQARGTQRIGGILQRQGHVLHLYGNGFLAADRIFSIRDQDSQLCH